MPRKKLIYLYNKRFEDEKFFRKIFLENINFSDLVFTKNSSYKFTD